MKELHCSALVPDCTFVAKAETEDELMKKVAMHAKDVHKMEELTPELKTKAKAAIKTVAKVGK